MRNNTKFTIAQQKMLKILEKQIWLLLTERVKVARGIAVEYSVFKLSLILNFLSELDFINMNIEKCR